MGDHERELNQAYMNIDRVAEEYHQNYLDLERATTLRRWEV
jgi:hypothetical protein